MRLYIAGLFLTGLLQQQCSALELLSKGPEFVRSQAEQGIQPYFPHAKAVWAKTMLLAITCADLGPAAIRQLPPSLDNDKNVQQLKSNGLQGTLIRSVSGLQSFALGFPDTILQLDLATKQYRYLPASAVSGYPDSYAQTCKTPGSDAVATSVEISEDSARVYLGTFRATVGVNGAQQTHTVSDTLGIYTPDDFERAKTTELESRQEIIEQEFARKGITLLKLELIGVKTAPIPR